MRQQQTGPEGAVSAAQGLVDKAEGGASQGVRGRPEEWSQGPSLASRQGVGQGRQGGKRGEKGEGGEWNEIEGGRGKRGEKRELEGRGPRREEGPRGEHARKLGEESEEEMVGESEGTGTGSGEN